MLTSVLGAKADNVSVPNVTMDAGQSTNVAISLTNSNTGYVAFQMDLTLPEGVTIIKSGCSLTNRITDADQVLTIGKQGNNVYRLTSTSFSLTPISGTSGELIVLSLSASTSSPGGQATLTNIRFATASSEGVTMSNASFNITVIKPMATLVTAPTPRTLTYTGAAQELVTAGVASGGTMQYSLDGTSYSTAIPTGTDAGSYTVYYKVVGDANHTDTNPATVSVTISKAAAAVTTPPTPKTLTYTGSAQQLVTAGVASGGTMQYSLNGTSYSTTIPTGTNIGSYTVYYKVVGDANHTDTEPVTISVTISKATAAVTIAPTPNILTYTGSEQELITEGVAFGGTMQYSLDGTNYSTTIPTATNAGTYTVYYKVEGDENHYNTDVSTVSVTISKADAVVITGPTPKTLTYNGSEQELITSGVASGGTMQYSLDGTNYSTTIPTGTDAGEYTVYYKVVGDANHSDTEPATVSVTISKAAASVTTAPTPKTLTYTGSAQELITAGVASGGTMQYSLDGTNYSTDIPTGTDAGSYTVYYKVVGDDNHTDTEPATVSVTIAEAQQPEPEVTDISQLDNAVYIEPFAARAGAEVQLVVNLKNADEVSAYIFDMELPEGVTVATNSNGKYIDALSDRHDDHSRTINYKGNNVYALSALSANSEVLTGNDGAIRFLTLLVADDMEEGVYAINIRNASYSRPNASLVEMENTTSTITIEDYLLGDVNGNNGIDIADAVCIVNYLVGKPNQIFIEKAADTNKNGKTDIGDAVAIVNYLVGKTESLAPQLILEEDATNQRDPD